MIPRSPGSEASSRGTPELAPEALGWFVGVDVPVEVLLCSLMLQVQRPILLRDLLRHLAPGSLLLALQANELLARTLRVVGDTSLLIPFLLPQIGVLLGLCQHHASNFSALGSRRALETSANYTAVVASWADAIARTRADAAAAMKALIVIVVIVVVARAA